MRGIPLAVLLVLLLVALWIVIVYWPVPAALVVLHVTGYESPLPPQALAQEDVDRLLTRFQHPAAGQAARNISVGKDQSPEPFEKTTADEWIGGLVRRVAQAKPGGPEKIVLVYLSAQGLVNSNAEPCLVAAAEGRGLQPGLHPFDAPALATGRLVTMEQLLQKLAHTRPGTKKVILLDAVRWDRNWRLGIVANEFTTKLEQLLQANRKEWADIVVVSSCSPGECSELDLKQSGTLFGIAVADGLWNAADANQNRRITLRELEQYLQENVGKRAQRRGRSQQPRVLGLDASVDFVLAAANKSRERISAVETDTTAVATYAPLATDWLTTHGPGWQRYWQRRGELAGLHDGIAPEMVLEGEAWRQILLRNEALRLAGRGYHQWRANLPDPRIDPPLPYRTLPPVPAISLPLALRRLPRPTPLGSPLPSAATNKDQAGPPAPLPYSQLAWQAWENIRAANLSAEVVERELRQLPTPPDGMPPVELRSIVRFGWQQLNSSRLPKDLPTTAAEDLLTVRHTAELAAYLAGDLRLRPLLQTSIDKADISRRTTEDVAFANEWQAGTSEPTRLQYEQAIAQGEAAASALALRDRVWADMPYLLEWAIGRSDDRLKTARTLLERLGELAELETESLGALDQQVAELQAAYLELLTDYGSQVAYWRRNARDLSAIVPLERLLACPLPSRPDKSPSEVAADHDKLWRLYLDLLAKDDPDAVGKESKVVRYDRAAERGAAARLWHGWLSLQTAAVGGRPITWNDPTEEDLGRDRAAFDQFAKVSGMAVQWAPSRGEQQAADFRANLTLSDRRIRQGAAWLALDRVLERPSEPLRQLLVGHPVFLRTECDRHDYCLWQADRFLEDFLGNDEPHISLLSGESATSPYFLRAGQSLLQAAQQLFPYDDDGTKAAQALLERRDQASLALSRVLRRNREMSPLSDDFIQPNTGVLEVQATFRDPLLAALPPGQSALFLRQGDWSRALSKAGVKPGSGGYVRWPIEHPDELFPPRLSFLAPLEDREPKWRLDFYYRGHGDDIGVEARPWVLERTIVSHPPGEQGTLTVNSNVTRAKLLIVLDCSESMGLTKGRMDAALSAVRGTIKRLCATQKVHVVLACFGHRVPPNLSEASWRDPVRRTAKNYDAVQLQNDFEIVWSGSAIDAELDRLIGAPERIEPPAIQPLGFTPLYDAITYAVRTGLAPSAQQPSLSPSGTPYVLIVSDGGDGVPGVPNYNDEKPQAARAAAAVKALREHNVKSENVFLFNLDAKTKLSKVIKVDIPADNEISAILPDALAARMIQNLGVVTYRINDQSGMPKYGSTDQPRTYSLAAGTYSIECESGADQLIDSSLRRSFRIAGGEACIVDAVPAAGGFRFDFVRSSPQLDALAEQRDVPVLEEDPSDFTQHLHVFCLAEPNRLTKECAFSITVQSEAMGGFSPRPAESWIEIVPARTVGDQAVAIAGLNPYVFCDPYCMPDQPVPVLRLVTPDWPKEADQAWIKVWLRMTHKTGHPAPAVGELPRLLTSADNHTIQISRQLRQSGAIQVVTIEERHDKAQSVGERYVHVTLPGIGPLHQGKIERSYFPANGRVKHEYSLRGLSAQDVAHTPVVVVPQREWKAAAIAVPPLLVKLPK